MNTKGSAGRRPAQLERCVDAAEDLLALVNELQHGHRRLVALMDAADAELERVLRAALMLRAYPVALAAVPSTTPTRGRVYALAEARTRKAALAAQPANAA